MQQIYTNRKPPKCYFITDYRQLDFLAKKLIFFISPFNMAPAFMEIVTLYMCSNAQLRPTGWNHMDCSPPGSSVHGILQARVLEWSAISLQRIFLTQGWKPHLLCLLHWQADSLPLAPPGKPHCVYVVYIFYIQREETEKESQSAE